MAIITNLTYQDALSLVEEKLITLSGSTVTVYTGEDIPQTVVPELVPMSNARVVLMNMGYLASVDSAIANLGSTAAIMWEYSPYLGRSHPMVVSVMGGLGITSDELDTLFISAEAM